MEKKKCFTCKVEKPLSEFEVNRMKYRLKSDLGVCIVCKDCELARALEALSIVKYDFTINKFVIIDFQTKEEVLEHFKQRD